MRYPVLFTLACCLAFPAFAEDAKVKPDTLSIYGRDFSVMPFQMAQPSLPWSDVKSCLPVELTQTPVKPLSDDMILTQLESLQTEAEAKFEQLLENVSAIYSKAHPKLKLEDVEYRVASDALKQSSPPSDLYKAACTSLALTYAHDMIYAKVTPPPPAPGKMDNNPE